MEIRLVPAFASPPSTNLPFSAKGYRRAGSAPEPGQGELMQNSLVLTESSISGFAHPRL